MLECMRGNRRWATHDFNYSQNCRRCGALETEARGLRVGTAVCLTCDWNIVSPVADRFASLHSGNTGHAVISRADDDPLGPAVDLNPDTYRATRGRRIETIPDNPYL